jgi:hypothetical protein
MNRRDSFKVSLGALAASAVAPSLAQAAQAGEAPKDREPFVQYGRTLAKNEEANPLGVSKVAFNMVSPDLAASKRLYKDCYEYDVVDEGTISKGQSEAPGIGAPGRKYISFQVPGRASNVIVRVFEAPPGAVDNRPRPNSNALDPGLLVIEQGTPDPAESYARIKSFNVPTISTPRYYLYRNTNASNGDPNGRDFDVMSYTSFGPGGEQLFTTAQVSSNRTMPAPGARLHSGFGGTSVTSLDDRPVLAFYEKALGLRQTTVIGSYQNNNNDLVGVPRGSFHTWAQVAGLGEVWQYWAAKGTCYPTSLDRKGYAMVTMQVKDFDGVKKLCAQNRIKIIGQGALPLPSRKPTQGFYIRGAVGELIEVIPA